MPRENQRRTNERNREMSAKRRQAGEPPPSGPRGQGLGGGGNEPLRVQIMGGHQEFFENFKRALGITTEPGKAGAFGAGGEQFRALLGSQEALTQASKQIQEEMKASTAMMREFTAASGKQYEGMTKIMQEMVTENRRQTENLITAMGMGGGPGGGGDGGLAPNYRGYMDPRTGFRHHTTSLGMLRTRGRETMAGRIEQRFGFGDMPPEEQERLKQESPRRYGQMLAASRVASGLNYGGAAGALRAAPVVGGIMAAGAGINRGAEWLTEQRAQNAAYQNVYGVENTGGLGGLLGGVGDFFGGGGAQANTGFGGRMAEEGYVLGQRFSWGGMTEEQSRTAFRGVSGLGFNARKRDESLGFIAEQYKTLGMDVEQSLRLVQLQAKHATVNLGGLSKELQGVTRSARRTGQSAAELQRIFTGNMEMATMAGAGAMAPGLAGAMTNVTAGVSRTLGGFQMGGMFTDQINQYAMASMAGTTPGRLQAQAAQGNVAPMMRAGNQWMQTRLQGALGAGLTTRMTELAQQYGGIERLRENPDALGSIANEMMQSTGWDVMMMRTTLDQMGIPTQDKTDAQIAEFIVSQSLGNNLGTEANKIEAASKRRKIGHAGPSHRTAAALSRSKFAEMRNEDILGLVGITSDEEDAEMRRTRAWEAVAQREIKTGVFDPAIRAATEKLGFKDEVGIRVQTRSGKAKVVSLEDAIRLYPEQISTGQARVMSPDKDLNEKKLSELGITPSMSVDEAGKPKSNVGMDVKSKQRGLKELAGEAGEGEGGGKVTVSLAPGVAQLFQFSGTGVDIESAAASNMPPSLSPSSSPAGTG